MNRSAPVKLLSMLFISAMLLSACAGGVGEPVVKEVLLATTTSTRDSGLLDALLPVFEEQTGYIVQVIAVGSGEALKMGEEGNADVLFVHAPSSEVTFMEDGFGSDRRLVMHNDFIIIGPEDDPAGISGMTSASEAFTQIAASEALFVSRGDDSGTHKKELSLWEAAGITPDIEWYEETGQGMGATLIIASEEYAYTLTDRATYLATQGLLLDILVEGDPALLNVYHVIIVNPEIWPNVNLAGATAFADFLVSDECQTLIAGYGMEEYGQVLFFPDADKTDADLGLP